MNARKPKPKFTAERVDGKWYVRRNIGGRIGPFPGGEKQAKKLAAEMTRDPYSKF